MNTLRHLTAAVTLAACTIASACAATVPPPHAERDAELHVELSEGASPWLIGMLVFNAFVVATGVRIARIRAAREPQAAQAAPMALSAEPHVAVPEAA